MERLTGQGFTKTLGIDAPEIVLSSIDKNNRDLLPVCRHQLGVVEDVDALPVNTELGAQLRNGLFGDLTEMATGFGIDRDARRCHDWSSPRDSLRASARKRPFATLPVAE